MNAHTIAAINDHKTALKHSSLAPFLANVNCLLSVTFVHPTQAIEIFGNVSTPFNTLAIC